MYKKFCGILLFVSLVACSEQAPKPASDNLMPQNRSNNSIIYGTWESLCEYASHEYVKTHLSFDNGVFLQKFQFHPDSNCILVEKQATIITGSYNIGNEVVTPSGITAYELDIAIVDGENELNHLDLFYLQGDVLYKGILNSDQTRPPDIDLNYPYYRKFNRFITLSPDIDIEYKPFHSPQTVG